MTTHWWDHIKCLEIQDKPGLDTRNTSHICKQDLAESLCCTQYYTHFKQAALRVRCHQQSGTSTACVKVGCKFCDPQREEMHVPKAGRHIATTRQNVDEA